MDCRKSCVLPALGFGPGIGARRQEPYRCSNPGPGPSRRRVARMPKIEHPLLPCKLGIPPTTGSLELESSWWHITAFDPPPLRPSPLKRSLHPQPPCPTSFPTTTTRNPCHRSEDKPVHHDSDNNTNIMPKRRLLMGCRERHLLYPKHHSASPLYLSLEARAVARFSLDWKVPFRPALRDTALRPLIGIAIRVRIWAWISTRGPWICRCL